MSQILFRQLFDAESFTYSYLWGDFDSKEALIIDPVIEQVARDHLLIQELGLSLKFIFDTHVHADHITGADELRRLTGAQYCISKEADLSCADRALNDGDEITCGRIKLKAIATPGHTNTCMSYFVSAPGKADSVFTGDALFIRGTGRTDFQSGSSDMLYDNIHQKLFNLDRTTIVYPAHNYKGETSSSISEEIDFNPRVGGGKTKEEYVVIMKNLKLGDPKKLKIAVPANMKCGKVS
jgi:sulfur dioxygenase